MRPLESPRLARAACYGRCVPVFDLHAELGAIVDVLGARRIEHCVCGALALAVHGVPRATKDIDLVVPPDAIGDARAALRAIGYDVVAAPMTFQSGVSVHRVSRVESKELLTVDLITAEGPLADVFAQRILVPWEARQLWVVSRAGLVAMKRLAGHARDLADLEALGEDDDAAGS